MAKAAKQTETVTTTTVTLEMTQDEAQALHDLMYFGVAGDRYYSRRSLIVNIQDALRSLKIVEPPMRDMTGNVIFQKTEKEDNLWL